MTSVPQAALRPLSPSSRILVVKLSSLGDLFHALPAVHLIKRQTSATVDWVCHDLYTDLVRCFPDVERVVGFPRAAYWSRRRAFHADLRAAAYDLVLDLQGLLKSAVLVARAARAPLRIGPSFSREGARWFYDAVSGPTDKNRHAVEENLDTVRYLGLSAGPIEFPVRFPETTPPFRGRAVGLLPCSRQPRKNWDPARFAHVARALRDRFGVTPVLLGGPADAAVCRGIAEGIGPDVVDLCGRTSLAELGGLLRRLDLLITVDSGPMHMAAAVGTPVVAVFGPTDPLRTGPYGPGHCVVRRGADLRQITVEDVVQAASPVLAARA
jgi:heptosyltransferase-1